MFKKKQNKTQNVGKTLEEIHRKETLKKFEDLYNLVREWPVTDTAISAMVASGTIEQAFQAKQTQWTVGELGVQSEDPQVKDLISFFHDSTLQDAVSFLRGIQNAIETTLRKNNKEIMVKDIKIILTNPDTGKTYEAK